jgi:hypothetical protein
MPRPRRSSNIEDRINDLVTRNVSNLVAEISVEIRRNIAEELRSYLTGNGAAGRGGRAIAARVGRPKRILPCIAPNCKNPSKGPRFHYLCEEHKNASKKDYEAWRRAKMQKQLKAAAAA